jgi:hypothetical protein
MVSSPIFACKALMASSPPEEGRLPLANTNPARFELKQSSKLPLTSYSGLALVGQCCQIAQVDAVIDPKIPVSQGMRTSDLVKGMVGLLSLGKSDFEAIEPFRQDRFFKQALWGCRRSPAACGCVSGWTAQPV